MEREVFLGKKVLFKWTDSTKVAVCLGEEWFKWVTHLLWLTKCYMVMFRARFATSSSVKRKKESSYDIWSSGIHETIPFSVVWVHHHCNSLWNTLHLRECLVAGIEYVNVTVPSINIWFFLFLILFLRYIPPSSSSKVQSWKEVCVCIYILSPTTIWLLFFSPWIYSSTLHTFLVFVFAPFCPFFTNYDECTMNSHTCQCFFSRVLSFSKKN